MKADRADKVHALAVTHAWVSDGGRTKKSRQRPMTLLCKFGVPRPVQIFIDLVSGCGGERIRLGDHLGVPRRKLSDVGWDRKSGGDPEIAMGQGFPSCRRSPRLDASSGLREELAVVAKVVGFWRAAEHKDGARLGASGRGGRTALGTVQGACLCRPCLCRRPSSRINS